jgi:hypothetical protein
MLSTLLNLPHRLESARSVGTLVRRCQIRKIFASCQGTPSLRQNAGWCFGLGHQTEQREENRPNLFGRAWDRQLKGFPFAALDSSTVSTTNQPSRNHLVRKARRPEQRRPGLGHFLASGELRRSLWFDHGQEKKKEWLSDRWKWASRQMNHLLTQAVSD